MIKLSIIFMSWILVGGAPIRAEQIPFVMSDVRAALDRARTADLPVLLHFYGKWCGPCQNMEETVFSSPHLEDSLKGKVILVKVDGDKHRDLCQMYQVSVYPADVFVDPQGRVLRTSTGMASLGEYISQAQQVGTRYQQSRQLLQARQEAGNSPARYSSMEVKLGPAAPFPESLWKTTPAAQHLQVEQEPTQDRSPEVVFVALDGYCPVKLKQARQWIRGQTAIVVEYQQQQYRLSGKLEQKEFEKNPELFAPQLLGCDPVIIWETDRALPGKTEFAAYFKDQLYLFTSQQNREMFRIDPERFLNIKHVLAPRDVEASLIR